MKTCMCCKRNNIIPTFSFYCRFCYNVLDESYGLDVPDYLKYFNIMYNTTYFDKYRPYNSLQTLHDIFRYDLFVTDKSLPALLEIILYLKVFHNQLGRRHQADRPEHTCMNAHMHVYTKAFALFLTTNG